MKYISLFIFCSFFVKNSFASGKTVEDIIRQYNTGHISEIASHTSGTIDGIEHVAIIAEQASPTYGGPVIIFYQKEQNKSKIVTTIDLQGDYSSSYNLVIKNNSLYIENLIGHHGLHGSRYQFKKIDDRFRLIGVETRSEALGCYSGDESEKCGEYEAWSGTSYNFLNSSAICWRSTFSFRDKRKMKEEANNKEYWHQPKTAIRHLIAIKQVKPPLLDGFDFWDYSLPNACYFDYKNKLQIEQP